MDWHQPDYGIRRPWNDLATNPPNMDRYMVYLKSQLQEIITHYGPLGILWFDGEWEDAWTTDRGIEIYNYIRGLQPNLIVNNRVGRARAGMSGMNKGAGVGDYGTPEQEIPATGFGPGVYWESCMTMNDHWGYNQHDQNFKSTSELVHNLIDCASKGGNYLLNVGPTSEGLFPAASVERLKQIGEWMHANSESIYATEAGPLGHLPWGRCTQKTQGSRTTLYLHVFDWPSDGKLVVPGLLSTPNSARLLVSGQKLHSSKTADGIVIEVPQEAPDKISTTVVLRIKGKVQVADAQH
jgi:alpha-L-fucosidase